MANYFTALIPYWYGNCDFSTFYGILGFLIHIRPFPMILFILMTWESGGNTYGNFCSKNWKIWVWRENLPNCRPFWLSGSYCLWLISSFYHTRMGAFPRWNGLKHFYNVTTIKFTDGQSFYDILKVSIPLSTAKIQGLNNLLSQCILPCIVSLLPKGSALIHCIRAYQCYRILVGLHCMTESRITKLKSVLKDYEKYCTASWNLFTRSHLLLIFVEYSFSHRNMAKTLIF